MHGTEQVARDCHELQSVVSKTKEIFYTEKYFKKLIYSILQKKEPMTINNVLETKH
jgi:hypothetical protein